eukprot:6021016-Amphidinium_carterae.1
MLGEPHRVECAWNQWQGVVHSHSHSLYAPLFCSAVEDIHSLRRTWPAWQVWSVTSLHRVSVADLYAPNTAVYRKWPTNSHKKYPNNHLPSAFQLLQNISNNT